jgi:acyl transferase domain-containing protein/acyl carrier protein
MAASNLEAALSQLQIEVSNCEKALFQMISERSNMSENTNVIHQINQQPQQTNIAIIGMASIFPKSKNLQEYWENIIQKVDCITDVPPSRWSIEDYYDPDPKAPDKTYCKRGGFIPDIDFNPMEFGLPPNILEVTDISQLLGLLVAKEAMEDAGYSESRQFNRERTGVILGVAIGRQLAVPLGARLQYPIWEKVLKNSGLSEVDTQKVIDKVKSAYVQWDENAFPGMLANVISGRIANRLDLGGINCVVDAACASSLGALKMAISELVEHRADMMITGGVDTDNSIFAYMCFSKTPAVSPGDKVKPFDVDSDGMMLGEGVGMLVIKRLEDAVRDTDRIYAVIKGIGSSSDGKYKSIYAPHSEGQIKALRRAYENAGYSPETVGLIEAHGTGTMVGDPTEFTSIKEVFGENNSQTQHIALGTVKSQIGHTKAAAGAASLIKTALALHHKVLPPTMNITKPHPKLNIESSPFYLNTETRPWISNQPRRAGVSAFGFGGTNYHVVLEEYENEHHHSYRLHNTAKSILLFASTTQELLSRCEEIQRQLTSPEKEIHYQQLIRGSQALEIPVNCVRIGFVTDSLTQAEEFLQISINQLRNKPEAESWEHPKGIYYRQKGIETTGKIVALFSGQGSQYLEMGREVVVNFPCLRETYIYMDKLLCEDGLKPLSEVVFPQPVFDQSQKQNQLERLQKTEYAQPGIGVFSAGLYKILQQAGFKADFVAGHSFGELTALWAGGVLSEEDYFFLVRERGKAMATPAESDAGGMLAVKGDINQLKELIKDFPQVAIANWNSQRQVVLAGKTAEITKVQNVLKEKGFSTFLLEVSAAFHTPLVSHAQKPFAQAIDKVTFNSAKIPVYTNLTGGFYPNEAPAIQKNLKEHLLNQVLFQQEVENIYKAGGYCFVEFGPKNVLTNLVKEILGDKPHIAVALNRNSTKNSDVGLREAVIQLRVAGVALQNIDPYQIETKIPEVNQKKVLNVPLNSTNITHKAQRAFAQALENGHQISANSPQAEPQPAFAETTITLPRIREDLEEEYSYGTDVNDVNHRNNSNLEKVAIQLPNYDRVIDSLEHSLAEFTRQQRDIIHVHEQYLENQTEYTKTFYELMQQQYTLLENGEINQYQAQTQQLAISSSERNMMRFHDHQADTLRIHERYLNYQQDYANNYFQLLHKHYNFLLVTDDISVPQHHLVEETNGKTSVNRSGANISHSFAGEGLGEKLIFPPQQEEQLEENSNTITVIPTIPINIDTSTLGETLLSIVSDKTGYPVEMLDLSMDIEADLGIDSIKRVEILGELLELYPDLPKPNPEELGQLRTLGQIAEYIKTLVLDLLSQKVEVSEATTFPVQMLVAVPHQDVADEPQILESHPNVADTENLISSGEDDVKQSTGDQITQIVEKAPAIRIPADLSNILLTIVSDKTGYPAEMLELSMDIEADLGIDSIKRVEILGGLLELYPDLPRPNPEELAELRTLGQIVEYMQHQAQGVTKLLTNEKEEFTSTELRPQILRSPATLKLLSQPDALDFIIPETDVILITDDGYCTTEELATSLIAKGVKPVVLSFPNIQSNLPAEINRVILTDWNEKSLQQELSNIADNFGAVATFIHLNPVFSGSNEIEILILRHVFLIAKHLKTSLNEAAKRSRSCFLCIARLDGEFGLGNTTNFSPISAGLFGLTKSLNQEWESVFCRSLDLSPDLDPQTSVKYILAEIHDPNLLVTEVGYSSKGRFTLVAEPSSLSLQSPIINPQSQVFLVSGGAKGITAQCVIKLAQQYQCTFILLGRSSRETEPVWAEDCENEAELKKRIMEYFQAQGEKPTPIMIQKKYHDISSQREIQNTLKAIAAAGGKAEYVSVDVTESIMLAEKIAPVVEDLGAITGIIHGAGNLADKRIEEKTIQDFETVYAAKVKGLENLLNCVPPSQLKYLILFSSVVGFYGNIGQSDYAIANEILNKSAHLIKHNYPHCHVVAINWGPWQSGMVSPELKKAFAERGIETIPLEIGTQMLVEELINTYQDNVQIVIGSPLVYIPTTLSSDLKTYRLKRQLTLKSNPFLHDHVIASRPVLPATCGLLWMANACEQIHPGFKAFSCNNFKVLKGIVFDENLSSEYTLAIQDLAKIENKEIELAAKISSINPEGKIRYHFSTNVILKRQIDTALNYELLNLTLDEQFLITNQLLYQNRGGSLFHGITFQGVKSVLNASPGKLTIKCKLPQPTAQKQGQFPVQTFNPYIADVQIHALWLWIQHFHQVGCLPSEIQTFEQFAPVPFDETFYVTCEVKSKTESQVIADIITHNRQGQIYNRMIGAKGTILTKQIG